MAWIGVILGSFLIVYITIRFAKYSIPLYLILCAGVIIGIGVAFFDLQMGIKISVWCACLIILFFLLFAASGIITLFFSFLVLGPIGLILSALGIHNFLDSSKKPDKEKKID
jgi:hypothetical protein